MARHNAHFAFARRNDSGAVSAKKPGFASGANLIDHVNAIVNGDAFGDEGDKGHAGVFAFKHAVGRERRGDEDKRGVCAGFAHGLFDGVKDGHAMKILAAFAWRNSCHDVGAVFNHLGGVKPAFSACDSANNDARTFVNQDCHGSEDDTGSEGRGECFGTCVLTDAMLREFKEFAMKGNVMDLAVGVIIGAAFGKIITSLVDDLIMPIMTLLTGKVDFTNMFFVLGEGSYSTLEEAKAAGASVVAYGNFINAVVQLLIVSFALFLMVKAINKTRREPEVADVAPAPTKEETLLTEIRDAIRAKA